MVPTKNRLRSALRLEALEDRTLMSAAQPLAHPLVHVLPYNATEVFPTQLRHAYGIDNIMFGSVVGDGSNQIIAIIDAYNDPNIRNDLDTFDSTYLGDSSHDTSFFTVLNQTGGTTLPVNSPHGSWDLEESLDVEYAHTIAPKAQIILYEANSPTFANLNAAVVTAKKHAGVVAISMSYGAGEFSTEVNMDGKFTSAGKLINYGTVFLASTGDSGAPGGYPAYSANVVAVGGTSLIIDHSTGAYISEAGWSGSGGGVSLYEAKPSYQSALSYSKRSIPDVAFDADPNTGVPVIDTWYSANPIQVGGTSLSSPCWAGLVAITDQGRALNGLKPFRTTKLDRQFQNALYAAPSSMFHDIIAGNNGNAAGPGYDLVTGIGSPIADQLIPYLASVAATVTQDGATADTSVTSDAGRMLVSPMFRLADSFASALNTGALFGGLVGTSQHQQSGHTLTLDQVHAMGLL